MEPFSLARRGESRVSLPGWLNVKYRGKPKEAYMNVFRWVLRLFRPKPKTYLERFEDWRKANPPPPHNPLEIAKSKYAFTPKIASLSITSDGRFVQLHATGQAENLKFSMRLPHPIEEADAYRRAVQQITDWASHQVKTRF